MFDEVHVGDVDHVDGPGAFDLESIELGGVAYVQQEEVLGSGHQGEKVLGGKTVYTHNGTSRVGMMCVWIFCQPY